MNKAKQSAWDKGLWSKYTLLFILPVIWKGRRQQLQFEDLNEAPQVDESRRLGNRLRNNFKGSNSFSAAIIRTFGGHFSLIAALDFYLKCLSRPFKIITLGWVITDAGLYLSHVVPSEQLFWRVVQDALLLGFICTTESLIEHPCHFQLLHIGMKTRVAACQLVFEKSLRLSPSALAHETTTSQVVNLLSSDVIRFDQAPLLLSHLIVAPAQTIVVTAILALNIGLWPTVTALITIISFFLLQTLLGYKFSLFRRRRAQSTDQRLRWINNLLTAIKVIKMYVWERPFGRLVSEARQKELAEIAKASGLRVFNFSIYYISTGLVWFPAVVVYFALNQTMTPSILFIVKGLAFLIHSSVTDDFTKGLAFTVETIVSCQRINKFLNLPENEMPKLKLEKSFKDQNKPAIVLKNVSCLSHDDDVIFKNLDFVIEQQELTLVLGSGGSGKSLLLKAIAGEVAIEHGGLIQVNGSLSYGSQEPWIFPGSIRENILFGETFNRAKYDQVLQVCSLKEDLTVMADGDLTQLGEHGSSLSGGQRARINLARALYADADIYLLDDPMASVDGAVARRIFQGLKSFLLNKTVVLVTHQSQYLEGANKVLILNREEPSAWTYGRPEDVSHEKDTPKDDIDSVLEDKEDERSKSTNFGEELEEPAQMRQRETLALVSANLYTYLHYIKNSLTIHLFLWFLAGSFGLQLVVSYSSVFVSLWTDAIERKQQQGPNFVVTNWVDALTVLQAAYVFLGMMFVGFVFAAIQISPFFVLTYRASKNLHESLFRSILRAPMRFFDSKSIGILLNRFSRDMSFVDDLMPLTGLEVLSITVDLISILALVLFIDFNNMLATLMLLVLVALLYNLCSAAVTRLKQMEGIRRSPIYSHLSASIEGLATIRAANKQAEALRLFDEHQNRHTSAWFHFLCASRWLVLVADLISIIYLALVTGLLLTITIDSVNSSIVGLLISQALSLMEPLRSDIHHMIDLASQMTSVQRIKEFSELKSELGDGGNFKLELEEGRVEFSEVTLSYDQEDQPVLNGLTFEIEPAEKVGIVGRSGAGKSSLVSLLFRLYDFEGSIKIDGQDIADVSLESLRQSIGIIPQEPVLFGANIRKNLDPFEEFKDEDIWAALDAVQLKWLVMKSEKRLELMVNEGGANFSVGQRQLLCLARAILRRNKILILDEATANVDPETDSFIQRTIADQFAHCTVITIAHRLITIANSDRVLVLDHGQVKEFAAPHELIQNPKSMFSQMVNCSPQHYSIIKMIEQKLSR